MKGKTEIVGDCVVIPREVYERMVSQLNEISEYITSQREKYKQQDDDRLVSIADAALYLRLNKSTIYRYITKKILPFYTHKGKRRLKIKDLRAGIEQGDISSSDIYLQNLIKYNDSKLHID